MPRVEATVCNVKSPGFLGRCDNSTICDHICINEGFNGGHCNGTVKPICICLSAVCFDNKKRMLNA